MTLVIDAAFAYLIILVSATENDGNCCLVTQAWYKPVTLVAFSGKIYG